MVEFDHGRRSFSRSIPRKDPTSRQSWRPPGVVGGFEPFLAPSSIRGKTFEPAEEFRGRTTVGWSIIFNSREDATTRYRHSTPSRDSARTQGMVYMYPDRNFSFYDLRILGMRRRKSGIEILQEYLGDSVLCMLVVFFLSLFSERRRSSSADAVPTGWIVGTRGRTPWENDSEERSFLLRVIRKTVGARKLTREDVEEVGESYRWGRRGAGGYFCPMEIILR